MRVPLPHERKPVDPRELECSREGCRERYVAQGLCLKHYCEVVRDSERRAREARLIVGVACA